MTGTGEGAISGQIVNSTAATAVTKTGAGTWTLSGANSYTGATTINAGTLSVSSLANGGANSNIGASSNAAANLVLGGGTLLYTGSSASTNRNFTLTAGTTSTINVSDNAANLTITGADTATTGALTKAGPGTLTLAGANLHTGATTLSAGTLRGQGVAGALGAGSLVLNGGTLELAGDTAIAFNRNTTVNGPVTIKSDRVTSGAGVTHTLGTLSVGAQTLTAGAGANVSSGTGGVTFGATTLSATGATFNSNVGALLTLGAVSGADTSFTVDGSGNATITGAVATGTGALTKEGTGTLTLSNAGSSFTGAVSLNRGTTSVASLADSGTNSSLGAGSSIVLGSANSATLNYSGASTSISTNRSVIIGGSGGGVVQVSGSGKTLTLAGTVDGSSGPLSLDAGVNNVSINGSSNTLGTVTIASGNDVTLRSATLTLGATSVGGTLDARATGNLTVSGTQSVTGPVVLSADGTLALNASISSSSGGNAITLVGNTVFNRDSGANLTTGGGGRWVIYSADPDANAFNGLASDNTAIWNKTFAGDPPASIAAGNRYVFSISPTLTYTSTNLVKTYGDDNSASLSGAYSISGLRGSYGGALVADTLGSVVSGAPSITSSGAVATANVAGSPYAINIAAGSLVASSGYGLAYSSAGQLTVNKAPLTVTADDKAKTYGGTDPALTYTVNAGQLKNSDAAGVVSGVSLSAPTGALATAGTHTITASGGTAANYTVTTANGTLTVGKASLTATADDKSKTYGGTDPSLTYTVGGTLFYGDTASVVSGVSLSAPTGASATAGTHTITASGGSASNYTVTTANGTLTVNKASLTATADDKSKTYGGTDPSLTYTVGGTLFYGDTASVVLGASLSAPTGASATAGTHTITASGGTAANYTVTIANGTLTVGKASLTVTADNKSKVYGATDPVLTVSAGVGQLKYSDTLSVVSGLSLSTSTGVAAAAGTHTITASGGTAANYNVTTANGTLTVSKAPLTVSADNKSKTYGDADPVLTYSAAPLQLKYADTVSVVSGVSLAAPTGQAATAGTHTITASGGTAANYDITTANGTLSVSPAVLVVAAADKSRNFGDANPPFTGSVSGYRYGETSSVLSGTLLFTTTATRSSLPGNYPIVPGGLASTNYTISYVHGNLAIGGVAAAPVTAIADGISAGFGSLIVALQGGASQQVSPSVSLSVPPNFSSLNTLPATGAGNTAGPSDGTSQGSVEGEIIPVSDTPGNAGPQKSRTAFRSECFGSPMQQLQCASR